MTPLRRGGAPGRWAPALCALAALAIAWPSTRNGWSEFDEGLYFRDDLFLRGVSPADLLHAALSPGAAGQYPPTATVSYLFNYALLGEGPAGFHAVDVLLFALVCGLVARLTIGVAEDVGLKGRAGAWAGLAAGLLFAAHPLHVEPYAWIAARKDQLSTGLALLAFLLERRGRRSGAIGPRLGAFGLYVLALGAKMGVAPLAVAIGLDAGLLDPLPPGSARPVRARLARAATAAAPYLLAGLVICVLWGWLQIRSATTLFHGPAPPWSARAQLLLRVLGHYSRCALWPVELSAYVLPIPGATGRDLLWLAGGATAFGLAVVGLRGPRLPGALLGIAWCALGLAPYTLPWSGQYAADRYAYFASVGAALLVGLLVGPWWRRAPGRCALGACLLAAPLVVGSQLRQRDWRGAEPLWSAVLAVDPDHPIALTTLGTIHAARGELDQAAALMERACALAPDYTDLAVSLAMVYEARGEPDRAEAMLTAHLAAGANDPTRVDLHRARRAAAKGDVAAAQALVESRLRASPKDVKALILAGKLLLQEGRPEEARARLEIAVFRSGSAEACLHAALADLELHQPQDAVRLLAVAERGGRTWRTRLATGRAWLALARDPEARAALQDAAALLPPGEHEAATEVAMSLANAGDLDGARAVLLAVREAPGPAPARARALRTLARVEALRGDAPAAARWEADAQRLDPARDAPRQERSPGSG